MAIPAAGPGVTLPLEDLVPSDAGTITVSKLVGELLGNYRKFFSGTAVVVQEARPGGPDVIEVQTSGFDAPVDGAVTVTTQPLRWNTSTTAANAIGGVYRYTATVATAGQAFPSKYVFRFLLDEQGGYTLDGNGNVSFDQVQTESEGVVLPSAEVLTTADLLDEDDMVSDSAAKGATQQSIKAYVDAAGGMSASTYDPTSVAGDAFARANHTGTQAISTLSDLDTGTVSFTNKTLAGFTNTVAADDLHIQVRNDSGSTIAKGTPVYVSGYNVGQELALVAPADASDLSTMPAIGVTSESIANNANGAVDRSGRIAGVDTSAFSVGDMLYVSETAGGLTATRPTAPAISQNIATVLRSHATLGVLDVDSPSALIPASATAVGGVELATQGEVDTGTDPLRVVTPETLAGSALATKVDGIETAADVTDTANVTAAGALMDSEVDANLKTLVLPASTTISAFGASLVDDADAATARATLGVLTPFEIACSDEATAIAATGLVATFRASFGHTIIGLPKVSLGTACATGTFTVDIRESGVTIFSTLITVDATEKTSTTAVTPCVVSDATIADDAELTVHVTGVGDGTAAGLKVYWLGRPT